jgi:hypothetical protein
MLISLRQTDFCQDLLILITVAFKIIEYIFQKSIYDYFQTEKKRKNIRKKNKLKFYAPIIVFRYFVDR